MNYLTAIVTVSQAVLVIFAGYVIVNVFKSFKTQSDMSTVEQALAFRKSNLSKLAIALAALLWSCFVSEQGVMSYVVSVLFCVMLAGAVLVRYVYTRKKLATPGTVMSPGGEVAPSKMVLVKKLQPGRIRGTDADSNPVYFSQEQLDDFVETRGHVTMLTVGVATGYVGAGHGLPIMGFYNDAGESFLLYSDDYVLAV